MEFVPNKTSQFCSKKRTSNSKPHKRRKVQLIFDETDRKDYLTGFRKRKQERRQKAHNNLMLKWKEEKKRIKQKVRDEYKLMAQRDIPDLQKLLSQTEYEADGKTVSILEVNLDYSRHNISCIGDNNVTYDRNPCNSEATSSLITNHDDSVVTLPPKRKLSAAIRRKTTKQYLRSKVFQQKQKLERKKNKHLSKTKKSCKLRRVLNKDKKKNSPRNI